LALLLLEHFQSFREVIVHSVDQCLGFVHFIKAKLAVDFFKNVGGVLFFRDEVIAFVSEFD
jgi:hypothetical protein